MNPFTEHSAKCLNVSQQLRAIRESGAPVRLGKSTSNLFRARDTGGARKLDVRGLNRVLGLDLDRGLADVEGMTPYDVLVEHTLRHAMLPQVTPQLKSITAGGAVSGLGIESSSFRFGLVHETVESMHILLADGRIVECSRDNNRDLFYGFPNSYGTLGYAMSLRMRLMNAKPYVHLQHVRFSDPDNFFARIADCCDHPDLDFLDGTVFNSSEMYLTEARFADQAPHTSDYSWMKIYYESIRQKQEDWLTPEAYIWRWDTDWFWCSKQFHAQSPVVRLIATRKGLNSRTYQRIMRLSQRWMAASSGSESVIQDVDIPIEHAPDFLAFLFEEIGITPIWICPFRSTEPDAAYLLYSLDPARTYINFGFWDVIPSTHEPGYFNRKVEKRLVELGGKKGLYSTVCFDEPTFWQLYNKPCYDALKSKYDPDGVLGDLYAKCTR